MMSETTQGALIQVAGRVIVAFITLIGAITLFYIGRIDERRDHNRQKIIETNKDEDQGKTERVDSAYSFFITVINSETETIEHPEIDITIDEDSRIVQISVVSENIPEEKIVSEQPKPNKIRVIPKYFNSGTSIKISILSINNKQNTCKVIALGLGVKHKEKDIDAHNYTTIILRSRAIGVCQNGSLSCLLQDIATMLID